MNYNIVAEHVMVLFLILVVGFIARKTKIINSEVNKKLSELLLYITAPFLIISSFQFSFSKDMLYNAGIIFVFSVIFHIAAIFFSKMIFHKFPKEIKNILIFITVFTNCGYMGFPVLESLYGKEGIFYGSIYVMVFNIFLWTYGVMLVSDSRDTKSLKKVLLNPGVIAVVIGMVIFLFSVKLPGPIASTLDVVGSMTMPLSMLIIGALLADTYFKSIFSGFEVYLGSAVRLLILPLLTLVILKLIGIEENLLSISVVLTAMPAATSAAFFARIFGGNAVFASRCVGITTILSIVTIPLILYIIQIIPL